MPKLPVVHRLAVLPQYLLPKKALTKVAGHFARRRGRALTTQAIRRFVKRYKVDMADAAQPDLAAYSSFNDFFTRPLREGARPLHPQADWLCPVDGAVNQFGRVQAGQIFQAKGHHYSAAALLGGDDELAARFADGWFATLYLSPRDYHRIHMPRAATLRRMVHVPGTLFAVNTKTSRGVPGLFARNERLVCLFDDAQGQPFVLVMVGATIVGSMSTVWAGVVNPSRPGVLRQWHYEDGQVQLTRGQEMGRFMLGSTVIMLMPAGALRFNPEWAPGLPLRMGQLMAMDGRAD